LDVGKYNISKSEVKFIFHRMVEEVTFIDPSSTHRKPTHNTKYDHFMRSNISTNTPKILKTKTKTQLQLLDIQNDKALLQITTGLVQNYTNEQLTGRDRLSNINSQLDLLGAAPQKRPKTSLIIHKGMQVKALSRVSTKITDAKNLGLYTKGMEKGFIASEQSLKNNATKKRKADQGIVGTVGKIKGGTMTVSKSIIEGITKKKSGAKGGAKSGRGGGRGGFKSRK
jgi:hypothetical protein